MSEMLNGYVVLLKLSRARRTYALIFANAVFHSGVFPWLGVYLHDRFQLGEMGVGLALLGYGLGSLAFGAIAHASMPLALATFSAIQFALAAAAIVVFRKERLVGWASAHADFRSET